MLPLFYARTKIHDWTKEERENGNKKELFFIHCCSELNWFTRKKEHEKWHHQCYEKIKSTVLLYEMTCKFFILLFLHYYSPFFHKIMQSLSRNSKENNCNFTREKIYLQYCSKKDVNYKYSYKYKYGYVAHGWAQNWRKKKLSKEPCMLKQW